MQRHVLLGAKGIATRSMNGNCRSVQVPGVRFPSPRPSRQWSRLADAIGDGQISGSQGSKETVESVEWISKDPARLAHALLNWLEWLVGCPR